MTHRIVLETDLFPEEERRIAGNRLADVQFNLPAGDGRHAVIFRARLVEFTDLNAAPEVGLDHPDEGGQSEHEEPTMPFPPPPVKQQLRCPPGHVPVTLKQTWPGWGNGVPWRYIKMVKQDECVVHLNQPEAGETICSGVHEGTKCAYMWLENHVVAFWCNNETMAFARRLGSVMTLPTMTDQIRSADRRVGRARRD